MSDTINRLRRIASQMEDRTAAADLDKLFKDAEKGSADLSAFLTAARDVLEASDDRWARQVLRMVDDAEERVRDLDGLLENIRDEAKSLQ